MSTPTTAVATLPPPHYGHSHHAHHPHHLHSPFSHYQQQQGPTAATASTTSSTATGYNYRSTAANALLPPPGSSSLATSSTSSTGANPRPLPAHPQHRQHRQHQQHSQPQHQPASAGYSPTDGVNQSPAPPPPPPHQYLGRQHQQHRHNTDHNNTSHSQSQSQSSQSHYVSAPETALQSSMSSAGRPEDSFTSAMTSATLTTGDQPSRKRQRSREPDWNNFYRNGLPSEIIVIEDSPEPTANTSRKITSNGKGTASNTRTVRVANPAAAAPRDSPSRQPAKRRRRDDNVDPLRPAGHHGQYVASHTSTPHGSTLSSDRTNSALHTTAPTSLSSDAQHEDVQPLKRKRTRQQVANEAKRRDVDGLNSDALYTYKPPPYPPKKANEVSVRVVRDRYPNNIKIDDEDGHYIVVPDAELTEQYQITRLLGQGTFGKVVKARDRHRNKAVAVKIIRSVQKYRDASRIELRVLATLKANDEANRNRCIHLRDCFDYRGHICIVMDLLGSSVFDFLKGNGFVPFPNSQIQNFARQLFTSVAFLHDLNLIHTDLKPENILLYDNAYQTFTYNRKIPSSSTTINRQATQRRVLLDTEIRLIDFGSATFQDEYHSSVVSTRHYRAPEIILGLGWSYPCDIWSIGCILVEFFTGDALFQTHDNLEHLAMMEAVIGSRIDPYLVQSVNKMSTRGSGNSASKYFKRLKLDYPTADTSRGSRRFVRAMKFLEETIPPNSTFLINFLDLLKKIFVYDPARRITAKQALNHPWFKEMPVPDDGTEAAKIRLERKRMEQENLRKAQYLG